MALTGNHQAGDSGHIADHDTIDNDINQLQQYALGVVVYANGAWPARPSNFVSVRWVGPVQPPNAIANDEWINNS